MSKKILLVDEKPFMVRLIQHHLERAGYKLITARNRQEAMQAMIQQSPELVVMNESANSGPSASSSKFRLREFERNIPVIRMTDVPQNSDNAQGAAEVVLTKPFSPTQLVAEVKRLVPEL